MAQADIVSLLDWTAEHFGVSAQERYERLLSSALSALLENPGRTGSAERPELGAGVRTFHLRWVRGRAGVAPPRHLIPYRFGDGGTVEVGRVLHDAMELERHAHFVFTTEP